MSKQNTETILLDDICYHIDFDNDEIKARGYYEFSHILEILLTQNQLKRFIEDERNRKFNVRVERIDAMFAYINSPDNHWRNPNRS